MFSRDQLLKRAAAALLAATVPKIPNLDLRQVWGLSESEVDKIVLDAADATWNVSDFSTSFTFNVAKGHVIDASPLDGILREHYLPPVRDHLSTESVLLRLTTEETDE